MDLKVLDTLKERANKRYDDFEVKKDVDNLIGNINDAAYILKPIWIGGDKEYVALFIDLNNSTGLGNEKYKKVMAKIYDFFTQSAIDCVCTKGYADYVDVKGDGIFAIFEGDNAIERAFIAGVTFRTFFKNQVIKKFEQNNSITLSCKMGIYKDKILVRKLGNQKFQNEVWAGRLINVISKMASFPKDRLNKEGSYMVISNSIYDYLHKNHYSSAILSCGGDNTGGHGEKKESIWSEYSVSNLNKPTLGGEIDKLYVMDNTWCSDHGQEYIDKLLGEGGTKSSSNLEKAIEEVFKKYH